MSRSHHTRHMRYPDHGTWFQKRVKFQEADPAPAERRNADVQDQLHDHYLETLGVETDAEITTNRRTRNPKLWDAYESWDGRAYDSGSYDYWYDSGYYDDDFWYAYGEDVDDGYENPSITRAWLAGEDLPGDRDSWSEFDEWASGFGLAWYEAADLQELDDEPEEVTETFNEIDVAREQAKERIRAGKRYLISHRRTG